MPIYVGRRTERFLGHPEVPADIQRQRRYVFDMMRRMGTPVIIKERFNDQDLKDGKAVSILEYANNLPLQNSIYEQTRNWDPLSHGVGYVGAKDRLAILSDDEYFDPNWDGFVPNTVTPMESPFWRLGVDGDVVPEGYVKAPKYRGYGQGNLTYIIQPDRATDYFKASLGGPLLKVQEAHAIAPWYPEINDNDLVIEVRVSQAGHVKDLDDHGIIHTRHDRFEAKETTPVSIRGHDRLGYRERNYPDTWGNRHVVNQQFEMVLIPYNDAAYFVEADR